VYVQTNDGRAWRRPKDQPVQPLPFTGVKRLVVSPNGDFVLAITQSGTFAAQPDGSRPVAVWTDAAQPLRLPVTPLVEPVDFSPDGQTVLFVTEGDAAYRWHTGEQHARRVPTPKPVLEARFSPDGQQVLTATTDGGLALFALNGAPAAGAFPAISLNNLRFSADGQDILAEDAALVGYLYRRPAQRLLVLPQRGAVYWKRFSPDERLVMLGTGAGLYLSNRRGDPLLATNTAYNFADFSPDGRLLVTQLGRNVVLWPSPDNLVPWLHQTYDDRTLTAIRNRAKAQYGIHTSFGEELWHRLKTALNR
jgi:WD40 repeat protein